MVVRARTRIGTGAGSTMTILSMITAMKKEGEVGAIAMMIVLAVVVVAIVADVTILPTLYLQMLRLSFRRALMILDGREMKIPWRRNWRVC
jgi:uncharacterized paraquat-inducible protein A